MSLCSRRFDFERWTKNGDGAVEGYDYNQLVLNYMRNLQSVRTLADLDGDHDG
jgi:hypothetical protein